MIKRIRNIKLAGTRWGLGKEFTEIVRIISKDVIV